MSQDESSKKKKKRVVKTKRKKSAKRRAQSRRRSNTPSSDPLILDRSNYIYMLGGVGLIILGLLLMLGGSMPSPDVWNEDIIYSFRRTVLAPFLIILGLLVEVYAIFKN